ncbi:hypothetical protein EV361DRAFT_566348 [Lentinula raphanica]|uniref:Homeobox domain-containing protein n=1 Tax=Lentinula raphanica TaxID=153919 RepID=A0AA38UF10_9AGAR|nr:hypothetical protein C8R42DRAFT_725367 [Lentinula raphanica]KAJ3819342.1 hypothetical protein F5880DRAFT_1489840 [Lentinula raphanica]KAJ3838695.1 hypothetical protein F5878DRAFT_582983 [Lentinula raphanica]KAJ3966465.1 hypothetical protein EV361DRAFT_566348 [Lentinula raphanica]
MPPTTRTSRREPLHIEPDALFAASDDDSTTPISAVTTDSPITPLATSPDSAASGSNEADNDGDAVAGSSSRRSREKRKRSRVTPEQLIHLERYFAVDRSPTAARRREISDLLGMQERQTQIWFQNRRAKAKMLDGKVKDRNMAISPDGSSLKYDVDLHNVIHEDQAVTFIPCTDLSIGTWRRIATTVSKHDLVAYVCEAKQSLAWFIISGGSGFKMEIPFDRIIGTEFTHTSPGIAHAIFTLSEPPHFYLEHPMGSRPDGRMKLSWRQCSDWTEGAQASQVLRHSLLGSAPQLAHLIKRLKLIRPDGNISIHPSSTYKGDTIPSPLEIPAPPMAGLLRPPSVPSPYSNGSPDTGISDSEQITHNPGVYTSHLQNASLLSTAYDEPQYPRLFGRYSTPDISSYPQPTNGTAHVTPVSRLSSGRPYTVNQETFPSMYSDDVSIAQSLQSNRRHTWANVPEYVTPSLSLLTTSFQPAADFTY